MVIIYFTNVLQVQQERVVYETINIFFFWHIGLKIKSLRTVCYTQIADDKKAPSNSLYYLIKKFKKRKNVKYSIVTGDETWCFQHDRETKPQSVEWEHPTKPNPKKSHFVESKIFLNVDLFLLFRGNNPHGFLPFGQTINAVIYLGVMKRLFSAYSSCTTTISWKWKLALVKP